jgi:hypothetical protein
VYGQYTDGTGKVFNTQFTVQSQLFPLTQEVIENSDDVTFDEATHTFSGAGDIGWDYTERNPVDRISLRKSIDLQDYQYIVVRMNELSAFNALKLYSCIGDQQEAFVDLDKMEVIIDLHQLPNIDLTRIEKVEFWVYNSSLSVKEIFLSNDGVNPVRYVQPTSLKASDAAMIYGDEVPQLPYTVSGFANVGTPKLTTTATKTSPVGTYDITAEAGSGADEGIRYLNGRMSVLPAVLTVEAKDVTITQGDAIPSFTLTYSGYRNGDTEATSVVTPPTVTTTATPHAPAGTYPITVSGGEATNYELYHNSPTLTIEEAVIEGTDMTARVNLEPKDWHATDVAYWQAALNAPAKTSDGREEPMCQTYEETVENVGEQMWQEIRNLPNGDYVVEVYANAVYTPDRGFESSIIEGANDVAYVEANGQRIYMEARFDGDDVLPWSDIYRINTKVTDGTLRIALVVEKPGTNWHTIQIKRLVKLPDYAITADSKTMVYGDKVPELTYTTEGWEPEGKPKLTTTATKTSPVGTYPIKVEKGTVTNEAVTYVEGTLTIIQAPLTVGVQDVTITEGDAIPSFTLTYSGFRNDDTEANAFTTKPTATTTATVSSMPGTYPISVSGGESKNYALNYQSGTLTILEDENPASYRTYTLTPDIFHEWDGCTATSKIVNNDYQGEIHVGEKLAAAELIYGDMAVYYTHYADVTKYNQLLIEGTPGMELRVLLNRLEIGNGGGDDHGGSWTELNPVIGDDGKAIVDLSEYEFVHLNAIKTGWESPEGVIDGLYLVKGKIEQPVTITANDLTMVYGDDLPMLTYSSEGGELKGTPKLSTTATKTSPVGTYPIKVEKGTVTNEKVTYVEGTLTITQAPLTVSVQDVTITEGDAIPSFTLTYSGFKNGDAESNAFTTKPTATTTATSSSKAGTYPITVSGGTATNYSLMYTQGTLTIKEKPVEPATVTANDLTMVYGDDVPTLTYKSSGAKLNGTPKLSTTATKNSPVGTYPIKVEKGTVTNEKVSFVDGTLTIIQAPLTVGVVDVTITEGEDIPTFTLKYSGFRNNDYANRAFTKKPTATTTATSSSAPGTYPITISGGEAKNYELTYKPGTLTIEPAAGIESVYADGQGNAVIYNVNGKKLSKPRKGINIIGGKKVVVK